VHIRSTSRHERLEGQENDHGREKLEGCVCVCVRARALVDSHLLVIIAAAAVVEFI
jgi:hypothetical protein